MGLRDIEMPGSRRRAVNLRVLPWLQLRLPIVIVALTAVFSAVFVAHTEAAYGKFVEMGIDQPGLQSLVAEQQRDFLVVSIVLASGYVMAIVLACLVHAHRMLGPLLALRSHLEGMKNGDYGSRISLRAGDPFRGIADDLNELASILRERSKHERD